MYLRVEYLNLATTNYKSGMEVRSLVEKRMFWRTGSLRAAVETRPYEPTGCPGKDCKDEEGM
jgi:hypothetical protein